MKQLVYTESSVAFDNYWLQFCKSSVSQQNDKYTRLMFDDVHNIRDEPEVEFHMVVPEYSTYKDLHADQTIPAVTMERLQDFLSACYTNFNPKVADLYKGRYIQYVRTAVHENLVYVTSSVWVEMKKTVSYKVDASLTKDGVVNESQCECAAGQGQAVHCKHVITVLFALVAFCKDGELLTDLTCTQVLQTFHKSKVHKGSPLKLKNFHEATGKESGHKLYDPRTNVVNKDKIRKRHRDVIINWPEKPSRLRVMQVFLPAKRKTSQTCSDAALSTSKP
ncbi:hypothetical protein Pmani_018945 [Petrolisthes manimaculis]|uniref:SWIM-type domain-containing protein n=1 Tax=Petrolisthes manimaculis TaxID=1843537 RepID=A0AAE1PJB9_9EUCA|nr:hypothetical protein Pmani_018945 [Petrolisthes manimaculis]